MVTLVAHVSCVLQLMILLNGSTDLVRLLRVGSLLREDRHPLRLSRLPLVGGIELRRDRRGRASKLLLAAEELSTFSGLVAAILLAQLLVLSADVLAEADAGRQVFADCRTIRDALGEAVLAFLLVLVEGGDFVLHA